MRSRRWSGPVAIARLQDAAGEPAPLGVGAGALRGAARMRERGAGLPGAGSGLEQLGMIDADQQHRALRVAQARRTQQLGQRAAEARLGTALRVRACRRALRRDRAASSASRRSTCASRPCTKLAASAPALTR